MSRPYFRLAYHWAPRTSSPLFSSTRAIADSSFDRRGLDGGVRPERHYEQRDREHEAYPEQRQVQSVVGSRERPRVGRVKDEVRHLENQRRAKYRLHQEPIQGERGKQQEQA